MFRVQMRTLKEREEEEKYLRFYMLNLGGNLVEDMMRDYAVARMCTYSCTVEDKYYVKCLKPYLYTETLTHIHIYTPAQYQK